MKQNPTARVGIDGHTDPRGTDAYNQGLSERRVNAISEALVTPEWRLAGSTQAPSVSRSSNAMNPPRLAGRATAESKC